jgi:nucleoside-diphosphate kinase
VSIERTLVLIKPDGVARNLTGTVLGRIEAKGYTLVDLKLMSATRELLEEHYAEHVGKPFYEPLVEFMLSGPIVAAVFEGQRVIEGFRSLAGATEPTAAPGHHPRRLRPRLGTQGAAEPRPRFRLGRVGRTGDRHLVRLILVAGTAGPALPVPHFGSALEVPGRAGGSVGPMTSYRRLGSSGLSVSTVGLGCNNLGRPGTANGSPRREPTPSSQRLSTLESTSSTSPTPTGGRPGPARRCSAGRWGTAAARWSSPPSSASTSKAPTARTGVLGGRAATSCARSSRRCAGLAPTGSTCTSCTPPTPGRPSRRPSPRWIS